MEGKLRPFTPYLGSDLRGLVVRLWSREIGRAIIGFGILQFFVCLFYTPTIFFVFYNDGFPGLHFVRISVIIKWFLGTSQLLLFLGYVYYYLTDYERMSRKTRNTVAGILWFAILLWDVFEILLCLYIVIHGSMTWNKKWQTWDATPTTPHLGRYHIFGTGVVVALFFLIHAVFWIFELRTTKGWDPNTGRAVQKVMTAQAYGQNGDGRSAAQILTGMTAEEHTAFQSITGIRVMAMPLSNVRTNCQPSSGGVFADTGMEDFA